MHADSIAIIDIGKTHTKLLLIDADSGATIWSRDRPSQPVAGASLRQLDVHGIEQWLLACLAAAPNHEHISAIVPIAHGAAAVLLDQDGQVLAAPDYEDPAFDWVADAYRDVRDAYADTYSPSLGMGLNLGRQLYFLHTREPALMARCRHIVLYPQYWAWRFSGVLASELTSLGCHSDLWNVSAGNFSQLAIRMGWAAKLAPLRQASEVLGVVLPTLLAQTGLSAACRVVCGLHDSSATYLGNLLARPASEKFVAISSGTWTVIMTPGIELQRLRSDWDMLANLDAFGMPVGTARFMGGREYAAIAGEDGLRAGPSNAALRTLLTEQILAVPCFAAAGGPFAGHAGRVISRRPLTASERATLATLYLALMSDLLLELLGATGDLIVDGPLATDRLFARLLATLRPQSRVTTDSMRSGPVAAARYLAGYGAQRVTDRVAVKPIALKQALDVYRIGWREQLPEFSERRSD